MSFNQKAVTFEKLAGFCLIFMICDDLQAPSSFSLLDLLRDGKMKMWLRGLYL